ncbi:uncharacterized protein LOC6535265 [Drosophila yakuba]|uniref:Peptidase M13 N-terminal domain-containing protein n=1 Tax=Drosophila yakuba TaxID=7245 RepID=B4PTQ0_DROYA|nr:uncharacterized protein LOC6535265 [Drosophila yakuba]EDW95633.1 uncharacterized protein Dyak_GE25402 [Drosophila yakuba]
MTTSSLVFSASVSLILLMWTGAGHCQVGYVRHLSKLRIRELEKLAVRMQGSINNEKYACENYFDYVCSRNRPLFSIMGHMPQVDELMQLLTELQNDPEQFEAKQKMLDFFISCNSHHALDDCYRETFEYFKPLFGYIVTKNLLDGGSHELDDFLGILDRFVARLQKDRESNPILNKLATYKQKFKTPRIYFHARDLSREYKTLRIYRESYEHNVHNLQQHRKLNSTYELGVQRTMLDWSMYLFQSRNKPMSYFYSTFSVHLYMMLFNTRERQRDFTRFREDVECLRLPQFVNVLDEARMLAVIYLKSFRASWIDYSAWTNSPPQNSGIYDQENGVLQKYHLDNKRIFFTLYAQNFCEFGKDLAENVFYLGLKQNKDFFDVYSCGFQTENPMTCV